MVYLSKKFITKRMLCFMCSLNFLKNVFHYIYANVTWLAHNLPNASICQGYFQSLRGGKVPCVFWLFKAILFPLWVCAARTAWLSGWRKQECSRFSCEHLQKHWLFNQGTDSDEARNALVHVYSPWHFRRKENCECSCLHLNYILDCKLWNGLIFWNKKIGIHPQNRCLSYDLILFLNFT